MIKWALVFGMKKDSCQECPALRWDRVADCRQCLMTGEWLPDFKDGRGNHCVLLAEHQLPGKGEAQG